ncbi:MAG: phosphatase PAP2 family protein [Actinobacteria bacterium]|nr:phosphatase PAP2 family protein [Actinomycetota bacterium]
MKKLVHKIRDLDRALFRVIFRLKWTPLTVVMRAFTVVGTAGFLWGTFAAGAFLLTGLRLSHLLVPWVAVALSWTPLALSGFLVALSRIYLGVHYPFDVLAGVVIGTVTAGAVLAVA